MRYQSVISVSFALNFNQTIDMEFNLYSLTLIFHSTIRYFVLIAMLLAI